MKSVDEFIALSHLETALAVRAAYWVRKVVKAINESDHPSKMVINELHAQDIIMMSKYHMLYLTYMIAKDTMAKSDYIDSNVKAV